MENARFKQVKKTLMDAAILKIAFDERSPDDDQRIQEFRSIAESVELAVCQLTSQEQTLINSRYFNNEAMDTTDPEVYRAMGISAASYYKIRLKAFEKLAEHLHLGVDQIDDT
ncbi:hypothetical protein [Paenibacillus sp. Soil750]|uniref:hypothetical protein n=1 Tax=Paenibacillus sp. Soil750 TaxID=1736398 RepID=UPI00070080E5|nr:hypothetical protein [Paenibacillus sp. Soil750]KRE70767.1 hypothetical protein ASL11_10760 [Paenibacillus sp. Soil750]